MRLTAAVLTLVGTMLLYSTNADEKLRAQWDILLSITNGTLLVSFGLLSLLYSVPLFFISDRMRYGFLTIWLGLSFLIYHTGMVLSHAQTPYPIIQLIAWKFEISESLAHNCWTILTAYLIVSGIILLIFEWRWLGQVERISYMSQWAETRRQVSALKKPAI